MGNPTDDLPPSYESITSPSPSSSSNIHPLPSPLTTHLQTLPARLRATHQARMTTQASRDLDTTALLVPHVEAFLADLTARQGSSTTARWPSVAELTLVPAAAVPAGWAMTGAAERRKEGEVVRVGRVDMAKAGGEKAGDAVAAAAAAAAGFSGDGDGDDRDDGDEATSSLARGEPGGFDEWGRFDTDDGAGGGAGGGGRAGEWWFRDEEMARRLAAYLRPEPNLERKHVQAAVAERKVVPVKEEKPSSGWRWGLGGGSSRKKAPGEEKSPIPSPVTPSSPSPSVGTGSEIDDWVKMTVRAEEVTFRKENEFGVWESRRGWGVVVTVRVAKV
ncbi:hypothetical protein MFIFM68171_08343 [Madurella fahalii]|uniref:Uncharacterized protein n=1 Tax=Madurella fahalii TaxID=1157608 RepID=A0ABQ0GK42_9PEZI